MFGKTKLFAFFSVVTLISIFCVNCSHNTIQPFPDPASGCAFFTKDYHGFRAPVVPAGELK